MRGRQDAVRRPPASTSTSISTCSSPHSGSPPTSASSTPSPSLPPSMRLSAASKGMTGLLAAAVELGGDMYSPRATSTSTSTSTTATTSPLIATRSPTVTATPTTPLSTTTRLISPLLTTRITTPLMRNATGAPSITTHPSLPRSTPPLTLSLRATSSPKLPQSHLTVSSPVTPTTSLPVHRMSITSPPPAIPSIISPTSTTPTMRSPTATSTTPKTASPSFTSTSAQRVLAAVTAAESIPVIPPTPPPTSTPTPFTTSTSTSTPTSTSTSKSRRSAHVAATPPPPSSHSHGGGDKIKKRLARKAELARASRRRKKAYVTDLEEKVAQLTRIVAELTRANQLGQSYVPKKSAIAPVKRPDSDDDEDSDDPDRPSHSSSVVVSEDETYEDEKKSRKSRSQSAIVTQSSGLSIPVSPVTVLPPSALRSHMKTESDIQMTDIKDATNGNGHISEDVDGDSHSSTSLTDTGAGILFDESSIGDTDYIIKSCYHDDVRRFGLSRTHFTHPALVNMLHRIYPHLTHGCRIRYKDDENDWVHITTTAELREAHRLVSRGATSPTSENGRMTLLKLYIEDVTNIPPSVHAPQALQQSHSVPEEQPITRSKRIRRSTLPDDIITTTSSSSSSSRTPKRKSRHSPIQDNILSMEMDGIKHERTSPPSPSTKRRALERLGLATPMSQTSPTTSTSTTAQSTSSSTPIATSITVNTTSSATDTTSAAAGVPMSPVPTIPAASPKPIAIDSSSTTTTTT